MSDRIHWVLESRIRNGKLGDVRHMMEQLSSYSRDHEPGTLVYEWYVSNDETACHIVERFADEDALVSHVRWFSTQHAEQLLALLDPIQFNVYCRPTPRIEKALAPLQPTYFTPLWHPS